MSEEPTETPLDGALSGEKLDVLGNLLESSDPSQLLAIAAITLKRFAIDSDACKENNYDEPPGMKADVTLTLEAGIDNDLDVKVQAVK